MTDRKIFIGESVLERHLEMVDKLIVKLKERYPDDLAVIKILDDVLKSNDNFRMYVKTLND
jgi:hypothetical protein